MNLRPLGYEGDGGSHVGPLRATYSNKNAAFPPPLLLSVALSCHQFPHNSRTVWQIESSRVLTPELSSPLTFQPVQGYFHALRASHIINSRKEGTVCCPSSWKERHFATNWAGAACLLAKRLNTASRLHADWPRPTTRASRTGT